MSAKTSNARRCSTGPPGLVPPATGGSPPLLVPLLATDALLLHLVAFLPAAAILNLSAVSRAARAAVCRGSLRVRHCPSPPLFEWNAHHWARVFRHLVVVHLPNHYFPAPGELIREPGTYFPLVSKRAVATGTDSLRLGSVLCYGQTLRTVFHTRFVASAPIPPCLSHVYGRELMSAVSTTARCVDACLRHLTTYLQLLANDIAPVTKLDPVVALLEAMTAHKHAEHKLLALGGGIGSLELPARVPPTLVVAAARIDGSFYRLRAAEQLRHLTLARAILVTNHLLETEDLPCGLESLVVQSMAVRIHVHFAKFTSLRTLVLVDIRHYADPVLGEDHIRGAIDLHSIPFSVEELVLRNLVVHVDPLRQVHVGGIRISLPRVHTLTMCVVDFTARPAVLDTSALRHLRVGISSKTNFLVTGDVTISDVSQLETLAVQSTVSYEHLAFLRAMPRLHTLVLSHADRCSVPVGRPLPALGTLILLGGQLDYRQPNLASWLPSLRHCFYSTGTSTDALGPLVGWKQLRNTGDLPGFPGCCAKCCFGFNPSGKGKCIRFGA